MNYFICRGLFYQHILFLYDWDQLNWLGRHSEHIIRIAQKPIIRKIMCSSGVSKSICEPRVCGPCPEFLAIAELY